MKKILAGTLVTSKSIGKGQIAFDDESGLILEVGDLKALKVDYQYGDEYLVFAGMGDIHIHAREDVSQKHIYKEDFLSASSAALNGGLTHICDMPNNPVSPVDDDSYKKKWSLTERGRCPVFLYAGIGPSTRPLSFKVPYKAYMGPSVGELFFENNNDLEEALAHYRGMWVSFHCEDPHILSANEGQKTHLKRRPLEAELLATDFALKLIEKYSLKGKLCHYSAGEGLVKIMAAKKAGLKVVCEVTPQHLYFSENNIPQDKKTLFQMNPPLREESDRLKMLDGLKKSAIDYLATDHAPHSLEEKNAGVSGLTGLDTYGAFVTWLMKEQQIDPKLVAAICSENPGNFINEFKDTWEKLGSRKLWGRGLGHLERGYMANFTILNMEKPYCVTKEKLLTKAKWSPFEGVTFPGSVHHVFLGGQKIKPF